MPIRLGRHRHHLLAFALLAGGAVPVVAPALGAARPLVTFVEEPPARWSHPEAIFRFKTIAANTACRRDKLPYRPCRNKVKYSGMRPGRHTFTLRVRHNGRTAFERRTWTVTRSPSTLPAARTPRQGTNAATIARGPNAATRTARRLILSDEFDGTTLDTAAWSTYDGPGHAGHGLRRPSAVSLDGRGNLVITGRMANGRVVGGGIAHHTDFTYGRVEFRVKSEPDPTGTMSAVVLTWPKDQWSPEYTENDMYETGPRVDNRSEFDTFIHFGRTTRWQKWTTHDFDPSQWHTIAMEWYPDLLEIYVDGLLDLSIGDPAVIPDILHHVCIQLDGRRNRTLTHPVRMLVDYVRVYQ